MSTKIEANLCQTCLFSRYTNSSIKSPCKVKIFLVNLLAKILVTNDLKSSQIYWKMAMYELTDAQRTIANSRVSVDEAMIAMVTDKLFMIFTLFIPLIFYFFDYCFFYSFTLFYYHCIFNNYWFLK